MKFQTKFIYSFIALLLFVAVTYQFIGPYSQRSRMPVPEFDRYLPAQIPGWTVENKPIADSPEMLRVVETLLRYDAAFFRVYRKGSQEISIYLAYWLPGKVHPQSIDAHTPDVCWVANGWDMRILPPLPPFLSAAGPVVPKTNHREFTVQGSNLDVLYWHINGLNFRQSQSVDEMYLSKSDYWKRRAQNAWVSLTAGAQEQLFVRVSVNGDMHTFLDDAPMKSALELIGAALNGDLRPHGEI